MDNTVDRSWIENLLRRNRYLVLATTDGARPWVAPLEYILDADLNFYFFSPTDVLHVQHLEQVSDVAVAVFDHEQPEYSPGMSVTLNGVQVSRNLPNPTILTVSFRRSTRSKRQCHHTPCSKLGLSAGTCPRSRTV